jgi:hypothetical protein
LPTPDQTPLTSWKEIAKFVGKGVRTVERWERECGLPVRRPVGPKRRKCVVFAYRDELQEWMTARSRRRAACVIVPCSEKQRSVMQRSALLRTKLMKTIRESRRWQAENRALTDQIGQSVQLVLQQHKLLALNAFDVSWSLKRSAGISHPRLEATFLDRPRTALNGLGGPPNIDTPRKFDSASSTR